MQRVLGQTSVDLTTLKESETSAYLVLPSDRLDGYARWLRLMIACALRSIKQVRGQPRRRILFLLDEFAHLGRMQPVARDIGLAGGYGLSFWLVVQDLSQLRSTYGESWPTFLANVDVLQAFGSNDWDTAEYFSKMTGETTIRVASENESRGISRGRSSQSQRGSAVSRAEKGRRLLLPDEVRRLPGDQQLLFVKGCSAIRATRTNYLVDREYSLRAESNPLYREIAENAGA
jgi:type IV secretion system protein VirD4